MSERKFRPFAAAKQFVHDELERTRDDLKGLDNRAKLITVPSTGDLSTTVLVGNSSNPAFFAKKLGPHLAEFGPVHFLDYPQRGFSTPSIAERFIEASKLGGDRRKAVIFLSMGQMVFNHLMSMPEVADQAGDIDYAIGDSGVTRLSSLQLRTKILLGIGTFLPPTHIPEQIYHLYKTYDAYKQRPEYEPHISPKELREYLLSTAMTSLYTDYGQWRFIKHSEALQPGALGHLAGRIAVKRSITAPRDYSVDPYKSFQQQQELWDDGSGNGGGWQHIISSRRPYNSHALGILCPQDFTDILREPANHNGVE